MDLNTFWAQAGPVAGSVVAAWLVLFLGRGAFQKALRAFVRALRQPLQLTARFLRLTANEMQTRNEALLRAQARREARQRVEREWLRLDEVVRRDVQGFPALQEALMQQVARWDAAFQRSGELPEASPEWTRAVAAIARLKAGDDPMMTRLQAGFQGLVERAHRETLAAMRQAVAERHRLLARAQGLWRSALTVLERVDNRLARLMEHALTVHGAITRYEQLRQSTPGRDRALVASAFVRLLVAGFVLLVAAGGAVMNLHLIAAPLRTLAIAPGFAFAGLGAARLAALCLIAFEIVAGLILFDALGVTHLFGPIDLLPRLTRRWLAGGAITLLLTLAGLEAVLAFVEESAAQGVPVVAGLHDADLPLWQTVAEGVLALVLPAIMAFVAIPLEAFLHALRAVTGLILETLVRTLAFCVRVLARLVAAFGASVSVAYDLLILPPLLLQRVLHYGASVQALRRAARGNR